MNVNRRGFLAAAIGAAAVAGGVYSLSKKESPEHEHHPDTTERKNALLERYRGHLATVLKLKQDRLTTDEKSILFNPNCPLDLGCMDERLEVPRGHNKISIAGIGAKMAPEQEEEFVQRATADKSFGPRVKYSVAHKGCAAHGKDEKKALKAAMQMGKHFNIPAERVKMAGYDKAAFHMLGETPEDQHIHPGMMGVLETGADFMEGNLGTVIWSRNQNLDALPDGLLPAFEIYAGKNMPKEYVGTQVGIMQAVFEGQEGMASVSNAPFILLITGSRKEIDRVLSEQANAIAAFSRRPEIIELETKA